MPAKSKPVQQTRAKGQGPPEGWPTPFPLASDAAEIAARYGNRCRNLGLWLDRFASWTGQDERGRKAELQPTGEIKRRKCPPLETRREGGEEFLVLRASDPFLEDYCARWQEMLKAYTVQGFTVRAFQAEPTWRMVVGLGAESVLETSIRLHRIYGFPIIPGTAVKGLARAYAHLVLEKPPCDPEVVAICGTPPGKTPLRAGHVTFFDAVPGKAPRLKLDVMNPHYSDYYRGGNTPPADYLSPMPVYFLTVEHGSPFHFAIAAHRDGADLAATAEEWLKGSLRDLGVGAKTTAGYGYLETVP